MEDWQGDYTDPTPRPGQYLNYTLFMVIRITGVRDQFWKWGSSTLIEQLLNNSHMKPLFSCFIYLIIVPIRIRFGNVSWQHDLVDCSVNTGIILLPYGYLCLMDVFCLYHLRKTQGVGKKETRQYKDLHDTLKWNEIFPIAVCRSSHSQGTSVFAIYDGYLLFCLRHTQILCRSPLLWLTSFPWLTLS